MIRIEIQGAEELREKLDFKSLAGPPVREAFEDSVSTLEGAVKERTPSDTGDLRRSIEGEVDSPGFPNWGRVYTNKEYARPVEEGSKPHFPPPGELADWAKRHGIPVFAICYTIAREGTEGAHMFHDGLHASVDDIKGNFRKAEGGVERRFG